MNKKINQFCQKIITKDILKREFYPVWFFTNERLIDFLSNLKELEIKRIFSIAGGGDFIFNSLVNFDNISEANVCDIRQLAGITVDLKKALIKKLSFEEMKKLLEDFKIDNKNGVYSKIRGQLTVESREVFDRIIGDSESSNFLKCLKKSGYWYKDSFWQKGKNYLLYLNKDNYERLKEKIDRISIYSGDFEENLNLAEDNFYDLIYISNILDSKKFCSSKKSYLETIKKKLNKEGKLLMVTQKNSKKAVDYLENQGWKVYQKELHHFNPISSISGHYCYSNLILENWN